MEGGNVTQLHRLQLLRLRGICARLALVLYRPRLDISLCLPSNSATLFVVTHPYLLQIPSCP